MLLLGGTALVAAAVAGFLLLRAGGAPTSEVAQAIGVRSRPAGAAVLADGKETGVVTDGEIRLEALPGRTQVVLTFRKAGYRDESRTVTLPLAKGEAVTVDLPVALSVVAVITEPAGAAVSLDGQRLSGATPLDVQTDQAVPHRITVALDGHKPQEVALLPGQVPREIRLTLEPSGPLGSVRIASYFPIDVTWKGKVVAKGQLSPVISLPQGRQALTLTSSAYFLRTNLSVDVKGGAESTLEAPDVGKLSIRANPDNCQIFIDGTFVDYPPILDKPVAAGAHNVAFKWPDGAKKEETTQVPRGGVSYVMGRKE